jgi:hypothetical protein
LSAAGRHGRNCSQSKGLRPLTSIAVLPLDNVGSRGVLAVEQADDLSRCAGDVIAGF